MANVTDFSRKFTWLAPLPVPEEFRSKTFNVSPLTHFTLGFMLNILSLAMPVMMLQVYDRIIPHQSYGTLTMLLTGVLLALALDGVLRLIRAWLTGWSASSNEHAASRAAMARFANADISVFERSSSGEHLQNLTALGRLREFYSGQTMTALVDLPFAAIFLLLIAYLGGILVVVPLALLILFCLGARFTGENLKHALERRSHADDSKASLVVSVVTGFHTVKSLAMESMLLRRFEKRQAAVTEASYNVALASGSTSTLSAGFGQLSLILTALAGCIMVLHGELSVGALSACTLLSGRAIQPIQRVLGTWLRLQDLSVSRAQADSLFKLPVQVRVESEAPVLSGRIHVERMSYSYIPEIQLLEAINLDIKPGEAIAIGGGRSSGKSTLLHLIAGILEPNAGEVRLDDINPARYGLSRLNGRIGYMPQHGTIFRGTILDNLTGFRADEEAVDRAKEAAADLGLNSIIDQLPHGYQTVLNDTNADPLPPGVKQRIALARVLMNNPSILLFDDADRALDKEGYNRLFRLMGRLKGECTLVMVSHDQNLLSFADRFYHLENGSLKPVDGGGAQNLSMLTRIREK